MDYRDKVIKLLAQAADPGASVQETVAYKAKAHEVAKAHGIDLSVPLTRPVPLRMRTTWAASSGWLSEFLADRPPKFAEKPPPKRRTTHPAQSAPHHPAPPPRPETNDYCEQWWARWDAQAMDRARKDQGPLSHPPSSPLQDPIPVMAYGIQAQTHASFGALGVKMRNGLPPASFRPIPGVLYGPGGIVLDAPVVISGVAPSQPSRTANPAAEWKERMRQRRAAAEG